MLQFNHSQQTNTNAVYPDITASLGTTQVALDFTQTYDKSTLSNVIADVINTVGPTNPWLVLQVTGSSVPTNTGQYNVDIYEFTPAIALGKWIDQNTIWDLTATKWDGSGGAIIKGNLLSTERAFVSGSNEYTITQYLSPTNGGTYSTYNYP